MADIAIGLAKLVVQGTLSKAQAAIEQEGRLRRRAQRDLVFITGEFQMMQSFLKMANPERVENPVVMTWVSQIRDLAYDVEDCIEFVVHLDGKRGWWWRMVPSWTSCCVGPVAMQLDEAMDEIEQLKERVEDVSSRNTRYSLISDTGSRPAAMQEQQQRASSTPAAAVRSMLGSGSGSVKAGGTQQGDLPQLLSMKRDEGDDNLLRVISVWGTSGDLGVASTIWKAYSDQQVYGHFARRAWVKLTHPFNPHEFIRCLKDQFLANASKDSMDRNIGIDVLRRSRTSEATKDDCLEEVERQLDNESYLVVLEDMSTVTDWDTIRNFFPQRKNGSCIIVSTQQSEVASLSVGHPYQTLNLNQFSVDNSIYAFYKEGSQRSGDKGEAMFSSSYAPSEALIKMSAAEDWLVENHLVARDSELSALCQYTITARYQSIQVMSVWGIPSVGKSALVKNMFCDRILRDSSQQKRTLYEKYGWVDISHPLDLRDFARSLLLNFYSASLDAKEMDGHRDIRSKNPILECQSILRYNRCLLVIDGLQSTKEWDLIQDNMLLGSHKTFTVVITSDASIARYCRGDNGQIVFNVKSLESDSSFQLFKNKVSSTMHGSRPSLYRGEHAADLEQLVSKCGGLPEVIVEIAIALGKRSARRTDYARSLSSDFMHHLESNEEFDGLQGLFGWIRSYFSTCPDYLKPCISYLSIFPRDYFVRRSRLVRRWIAEGYSRDSDEYNWDILFSDLLDQSIIQQPPSVLGYMRMVSCKINGFIREYIVSRRMEENLVFELAGSCTVTTQRSGRHLVILKDWRRDKILFESIDFSRLRSLTVFGVWESFFISQSMKLLRVLDLENASGIDYEDLEKMLKWLCRLKFLSLRGRREIQHLPRSMHHLRQLQTLDVRDTSIVTLPDSITKLLKLQYIRAGTTNTSTLTNSVSSSWFSRSGRQIGAKVSKDIGKLTALNTLGVVNIAASGEKHLVKELKKLTQLRKLGVSGINRNNSVMLFNAIMGHIHLESLSLQLDMDNQDCLDGRVLPLENLRSLKLYGLSGKLPEWISRLSRLAKLDLEIATPMEEYCTKLVGELPTLCFLRVTHKQGGALHFRITVNGEEHDSYRMVKVLEIACSSSTSILKFGSKTMKKLELLKIDYCNGSPQCLFSGLENLIGLKEILLVKGSDSETLKQQIERLLEEHPNKIKPIVKLVEPSRSS